MFPLTLAALAAALSLTPPSEGPHGPITTTSPAIRESLSRLWQGSASWRAALEDLRGQDRRVVVLTADQVVVDDAGRRRRFEDDLLAEVTPIVEAGGQVRQVVVVINLSRIEASYLERTSTLSEFHADLDRIVAHEVYGHALPYLMAGHVSGRCADPTAGQRPTDACAIRRENTVRAELGLGRRTDAGHYGLALARPFRH